ncbi:alpha/beta fold hydrolase [Arenibaculum sp.]|jgi:pimeloyl-ACP methyl ester carboxylesterase/DNA-binding winged helix-turn-helix (wHTH) protein|uniref:alpha/beta fold hydrolase n=1 Tax=Arenibaculum sp. TaxID=2865862 RepID=UPI002E15A752|nr:alpha/beta fold hydrolase [Arenibaculum sp.]
MAYRFGPYAIDVSRRELRRDGGLVHVEPQVFDLLRYLVENGGRVVGKDELLDAVWQGRIVSEATLSSRINAARRAIGDTGERQCYIRTVSRRGFLFAGEIVPPVDLPRPGAPEGSFRGPGEGQEVRFCRSADGVRVAMATSGRGDVLVKTANWLNHVEYDWHSPLLRPFLQGLSGRHRLVRYDERGCGLSDRDVKDISFEGFVRDLEAVVDALALHRFSLIGISQGAAVAVAFAARHPERVEKLVLHGGYALGRRRRNSLAHEEQADAFVTLMRHGWGDEHSAFMQAFSSIYIPRGTPEQVRWFTDLQRMSTSAENAVRIRDACDRIDVVDLLPRVRAPTLVTHSRFDHVAPFEQGRLVAASIPDARLVALESDNHAILPDEPAWATWTREIEAFLAG